MKPSRCIYLSAFVTLASMVSIPALHAQTTVAGSVFGAFNQSTTGNSTQQREIAHSKARQTLPADSSKCARFTTRSLAIRLSTQLGARIKRINR